MVQTTNSNWPTCLLSVFATDRQNPEEYRPAKTCLPRKHRTPSSVVPDATEPLVR